METDDRPASVEVFAPARLHLGFLDLNGGLGRRFGGLGVAIEGLGTRLTVSLAATAAANGPCAARALDYLGRAATAFGVPNGARITISQTCPEHVGLGSGTQLGLAVAAALAHLHGLPLGARALAMAIERRARSGIGIGAFERGGFVVDGGRKTSMEPATVITRLEFPSDWRFLLVLDPARQGLHGPAESAAFAALPKFNDALAGELCRRLMLQLLPGIIERDFAAVSDALGEIQRRLGEYFSPTQNGAYSSQAVAEAMEHLSRAGLTGLGQSSWGPTGFALADSAERADALVADFARRGVHGELEFRVVGARNRGADIISRPG
jgi:beta-RFAP synthase